MKTIFVALFAFAWMCAASAQAQSYGIDSFALDLGGGTSSGGAYLVAGAMTGPTAERMSGGSYAMTGEFRTLIPAGSTLPPALPPVTIFDNLSGASSGNEYASGKYWLANKFCPWKQSYSLDSVTLLLNTRDPGNPPNVRLQIYSDEPASGKPAASIGGLMELSGATNPIAFKFSGSSYETPIKWTPAAPLKLLAGQCYWVVLSVDSGEILYAATVAAPTGDAGALGRSTSSDAGATWSVTDITSNRRMVVEATPISTPPVTAGVEIIGVHRTGNELRISFSSVPGQSYAVQSRADVSSGNWSDVPGAAVVGAGDTAEEIVPIASVGRQFYRVQKVSSGF